MFLKNWYIKVQAIFKGVTIIIIIYRIIFMKCLF